MKILLFLSFLLCFLFADTDNVIIIQNKPTSQEQKEFIQTLNSREEPELIFVTSPKKIFKYEKMNCALEVPVSWNLDTSSENYRVMSYPYNEDPILITLKTYKATETITANTVYLYRSGSAWDRWHLLGAKVFNPKDCFLVGVDEKISGIYKKQVMTERLAIKNTIVAEDIYVKSPNLVYIVTAQAPEDVWREYSQTVKEILNSFYVTEDLNGKKL